MESHLKGDPALKWQGAVSLVKEKCSSRERCDHSKFTVAQCCNEQRQNRFMAAQCQSPLSASLHYLISLSAPLDPETSAGGDGSQDYEHPRRVWREGVSLEALLHISHLLHLYSSFFSLSKGLIVVCMFLPLLILSSQPPYEVHRLG